MVSLHKIHEVSWVRIISISTTYNYISIDQHKVGGWSYWKAQNYNILKITWLFIWQCNFLSYAVKPHKNVHTYCKVSLIPRVQHYMIFSEQWYNSTSWFVHYTCTYFLLLRQFPAYVYLLFLADSKVLIYRYWKSRKGYFFTDFLSLYIPY